MKKTLSIILSLMLIFGTICAVPTFSASAEGVTAASFTDGVVWNLSEGGANYLRTTAGWGNYTGANGSVTYTDPNSCRSVMANVKGFTAGTTYKVTFSATGISAVYAVLNYDSAYFDSNQIVQAKSGFESDKVNGTYSNGTATVVFTPTSDNIYLIVKSNSGSGTLSNFSVKELTESDIILSGIDNGLTWGLSEGGSNTLRLTNGWGSFTSSNGSVAITDPNSCRSTMANVKGFTAGVSYKISFNVSGVSAVYAVLNYDSAYFDGNQIVQAKSGCESDLISGNVTNGVATIMVTPTSNNFYLIVKNNAGSVALSNFAVARLTEADIAGIAIANGEWGVTKNAGGSATKLPGNIVSVTGTQYQAIYTKIGGLKANTVYELSFDVDSAFNAQIWYLSGKETLTFNDSVPNGAKHIKTENKTTHQIQFTAEEESYHFIFRNMSGTTSYKLSNFKLAVVKTLTEAEIAGRKLANGNWAVTQGAGGTITKKNDVVSITGAQYQKISVPLTGLEKNTYYTVSLNHTAGDMWQFANPVWAVPNETTFTGDALLSKEGTLKFPADSVNTATTTKFKFLAKEETYLLVFVCHNIVLNGVTGNLNLSNFAVEKGAFVTDAELAGNKIADGQWIGKNEWTRFTHDTENHTLKITDLAYQDVYTTISGLNTNTTYTLTYDHNLESDSYLFGNPIKVFAGANVTSGDTVAIGRDNCSNSKFTTLTFTTNSTDTDYTLVFTSHKCDGDGAGLNPDKPLDANVTLSNFKFAVAYEFDGTAIRAASEETTQGMRFKNTISKTLLESGYNNKQIVEYGNIVAYEQNINTEFTYENVDDKRIKKAVAYNKEAGTNVVFDEDANGVTYTAVLVGIKTKNYGLNCKVRSYMLLEDGSVIYGDVQTYSVYSMFNAILNGDSDADKAVVNNILADEEVNAGYNAWLAKN